MRRHIVTPSHNALTTNNAIHEAGHVIAACRYGRGFEYASLHATVPKPFRAIECPNEHNTRRIIRLMAGSFAEGPCLEFFTRPELGDYRSALVLLRELPEFVTLEALAAQFVEPFTLQYKDEIRAIADLLEARGLVRAGESDVLAITSQVEWYPERVMRRLTET